MAGVVAWTITTSRITSRVLFTGPETRVPVLFLYGNITSATWWEEVMVSLPGAYRGIAPDQRGFGAADPAKKIDATRLLMGASERFSTVTLVNPGSPYDFGGTKDVRVPPATRISPGPAAAWRIPSCFA